MKDVCGGGENDARASTTYYLPYYGETETSVNVGTSGGGLVVGCYSGICDGKLYRLTDEKAVNVASLQYQPPL
jgi:hypothetical protein